MIRFKLFISLLFMLSVVVAAQVVSTNTDTVLNTDFQNYLTQKTELEGAISLYRADNYSEALPVLEKLVAESNPVAEYYYASCLEAGSGLPQDTNRASEIYKKIFPGILELAKKNDALAQNIIGGMYKNGEGVAKTNIEAIRWYQKAANQGYAIAQNNLGTIYENGSGVKKDNLIATNWYRKAAALGLDVAEYNLGRMYDKGAGVAKNPTEAIRWYRKSAEQGFIKAKETVEEIDQKAEELQRKKEEKAALFTTLAGYKLGTSVTLVGDNNDECPLTNSEIFAKIECNLTDDRLWRINAGYLNSAIEDTTFEDLLAARKEKYGPPTKIAYDLDDCDPGVYHPGGMTTKCAIWKVGDTQLSFFTTTISDAAGGAYFRAMGGSRGDYGIVLTSMSLLKQIYKKETEAARNSEAEARERAKKKAKELLESE